LEIRIDLRSSNRRLLTGAVGIAICGFLGLIVLSTFITGVLADERVLPRIEQLESYLRFRPDSARLQAKLAEAQLSDADRDLKSVEARAKLACELSPFDYRNKLLLAGVEEALGDRQAAETSLESARSLAPNNAEVQWRQANLLVRNEKLVEAEDVFRTACASDLGLVPVTLEVLWRATDGSAATVESVTPSDPESQLNLAGFLLLQSRGADAGRIFANIPRAESLKLANTPVFINSMIKAGEWELARSLWANLIGVDHSRLPMLWNGSFEEPPHKNLNQFDWQLESSEYARVRIDSTCAHTGSKALKFEFLGRDTTKLDREISQQVVLRSGTRYRLECYVKTDQFEAPEGPQIVVADLSDKQSIAVSAPIATGTYEWRQLTLDFTPPMNNGAYVALTVSLKRKPRFSYDEPTRGIIHLDDFSITLLEPGSASLELKR